MTHRHTLSALLVALVVALGLTGISLAQEREQQGAQQQEPEAPPEAEVLATIHAINQLESQVALMAMNQASTDRAKRYAARVAEDHQELDRQLMELGNELDVAIAASPMVRQSMQTIQEELAEDLQNFVQAEGAQFDRTFADLMVSSHETAIKQIGEMRARVRSQEARAYIDRALQVFRRHLSEAKQLQNQLKA